MSEVALFSYFFIQVMQQAVCEPVVKRRILCEERKVLFKGKFSFTVAGTFDSTPVAVERVNKGNISQCVPSVLLALNDVNVLRVLHLEEDLEYR